MGTKIDHNEFFGFLRSRRPFPFFYGIDRGFCQHGIATNNLSQLQFSVGRNNGFHPDGPTDLHFSGELWIHRVHLDRYPPLRCRVFLSERQGWGKGGCPQRESYEGGGNIGSNLHSASLRPIGAAAKVTKVIECRSVRNPASHLLVIPRNGFFPGFLFQELAVFE